MSYASLEQRAARGNLDMFPLFIPDGQAPVSVIEQKAFYDFMQRLYQLAYDEPGLFVPKLHQDDTPPGLYAGALDSKRQVQTDMKKFQKAVAALIQELFLMGQGKQAHLNGRQKAILSRLGVTDAGDLSPACVWMASKLNPSRFAYCCFADDVSYGAQIYEKHFGNSAFERLTGWMAAHGYKAYDIYNTTASNCMLSLTYANPAWSEEQPRGGFEYKIRHTGVSLRYEPYCQAPWILGVCIPGGMKTYLAHFSLMPVKVQAFVMARVKRCNGCRYCVQTDKTNQRPLAKMSLSYEGKKYVLCPYYPGYTFWWTSMDDALADNIIAFLAFMDKFAHGGETEGIPELL